MSDRATTWLDQQDAAVATTRDLVDDGAKSI
jgi:hypothetical protein